MNNLRPFDVFDWEGFAGAANFADGTPPLIGDTNNWTVIVCGAEPDAAMVSLIDGDTGEDHSAFFDTVEGALVAAQSALDLEPSVFLTTTEAGARFDRIS